MSKPGAERYHDIPLSISGSTKFGRYPKESSEQTYNMIISDEWLVPFAGYKNVVSISATGEGRGIYSSAKQNKMYAVIDSAIYKFNTDLTYLIVGHTVTFTGDVFITENNAGQVLFSDGLNLYVYDSTAPAATAFTILPSGTIGPPTDLGFTPGYVTFQNTRFISPDTKSSLWRLSDFNNGRTVANWPADSQHEGALQTKPDTAVATLRFPGRGNMLLVFGHTVTEIWNDVGAQLFPYQRNQSVNLDYGCLNPATIAESENIVCWLASNEKSGPTIMYTNGGDLKHISTDGIDFQLANIKNPTNSYGFMFKQDGHLFYVISFPEDNLSYAYDFNTQMFFTVSDENMNAYIAKRVAFFNDQYYFVSIIDGNLYQMSSNFYTYDYGNGNIHEIPRIRITPSISLPDQSRFVAGYTGFTIEQGQFDYPDNDTRFNLNTQDGRQITTQNGFVLSGGQDFTANVPKIQLSTSKDGGVNYGIKDTIFMKPLGRRANKLRFWRLGAANDLVQQFEFFGFGRFVVRDGVTGVYQ